MNKKCFVAKKKISDTNGSNDFLVFEEMKEFSGRTKIFDGDVFCYDSSAIFDATNAQKKRNALEVAKLAAPPSSTVGGEGAQALCFHRFSQQKDAKKTQIS